MSPSVTRAFVLATLLAFAAGCNQGDDDDTIVMDPGIDAAPRRDSAQCATRSYPTTTFCGGGQYWYGDLACGPPIFGADGGTDAGTCQVKGDHTCHDLCRSDGDCRDPCRPTCAEIALYEYSDFASCSGRRSPKVCVAADDAEVICR